MITELSSEPTEAQCETRNQPFPRLRRAGRGADLPASFSQERVRFLQMLHPDSFAYNFVAILWLDGMLDVDALNRSLAAIVNRNEIYRTTFPIVDGCTVQRIHPPFPVSLARADVTDRVEAERVRATESLAFTESERRFDPGELPLVHWTLVRLGRDEHALIHAESHLVHDGWSFNALLAELKLHYDAYCSGREPALANPDFQFADFAVWQREWIKGNEARRQLAFWQTRLAGSDRQIALPIDRPHPDVPTLKGRVLRMDIPPHLTAGLIEFGRTSRASLFMVALAGFATLLHRHSGQTDVNIGSGIANRRLPEFERILGMFVNTIVFRIDLAGDPTFRELVQRVRACCLDAYENQDAPFEKVVEALRPARCAARQPFFQVMFSFHDSPLRNFELAGVETRLQLGISRGAKSDLNLIFIPPDPLRDARDADPPAGRTQMMWEFNTDLFDESTVRRLAEQYLLVLAAGTRDRDRPLSMLALDVR